MAENKVNILKGIVNIDYMSYIGRKRKNRKGQFTDTVILVD